MNSSNPGTSRCTAFTRTGEKCKNDSVLGQDYCSLHIDDYLQVEKTDKNNYFLQFEFEPVTELLDKYPLTFIWLPVYIYIACVLIFCVAVGVQSILLAIPVMMMIVLSAKFVPYWIALLLFYAFICCYYGQRFKNNGGIKLAVNFLLSSCLIILILWSCNRIYLSDWFSLEFA